MGQWVKPTLASLRLCPVQLEQIPIRVSPRERFCFDCLPNVPTGRYSTVKIAVAHLCRSILPLPEASLQWKLAGAPRTNFLLSVPVAFTPESQWPDVSVHMPFYLLISFFSNWTATSVLTRSCFLCIFLPLNSFFGRGATEFYRRVKWGKEASGLDDCPLRLHSECCSGMYGNYDDRQSDRAETTTPAAP